MDPKNKRKPVPAGGQPIPAAIAAADATPPASATPATDADQPADAALAADATPSADATPADPTPATGDQAQGAAEPDDEHQDDDEIIDAAVLVAFGDYLPDEIVSAPSSEIERLKLAGTVDPHPDAVAFVRSLNA